MPDVYATIAEADDELQERIAATLELRAADPAQRAMFAEYAAGLELPDSAAVLEVGSGTGAISRRLAELPGVARVTGIDPSPRFVARAKESRPGSRSCSTSATAGRSTCPARRSTRSSSTRRCAICPAWSSRSTRRTACCARAGGTVGPELAAALKAEARARMAADAYYGHIGYVSALARRP